MLSRARDVARYANLVVKPRLSYGLRLGECNVSDQNHFSLYSHSDMQLAWFRTHRMTGQCLCFSSDTS